MKFIKSLGFASKGIRTFLKQESNAKYQLIIGLVYLVFAWLLQFSFTDWCIALICIALVLGAEAFNTAVEEIVNFVSPDIHPQAGKIKDIAAGAVLLVSVFVSIIGIMLIVKNLDVLFSFFDR